MNLRRKATAQHLPDEAATNIPQLVGPRFPRKPTATEISHGAPLNVKAAAVPFLASLPEYASLGDEALIEMARQKTFGRLYVPDRWVAIALLLGTKDVLPVHLR